MNHQALEQIANQKMAEMRDSAAGRHRHVARFWGVPRQSLRVRTGWTLVDLGLRLAAQPAQGPAVAPRPAGS